MNFKKTGRKVHEITEYDYNGVRFLYKAGEEKLVVIFASFVPKNSIQKYHYLKEFISRKESFLWFLDSYQDNANNNEGRGSYFITKNNKYIQSITTIIKYHKRLTAYNEVILAGSSKGGYGALMVLCSLTKATVIINAPQYYIEDFCKIDANDVLMNINKEINCGSNYFLEKNLKVSSIDLLNSKIYLFCGIRDHYHLDKHIQPLLNTCKKLNIPIEFIPVNGKHDGIATDQYQKYLIAYLDESFTYLKNEELKKIYPSWSMNSLYPYFHGFMQDNGLCINPVLRLKNETQLIGFDENRVIVEIPIFYNATYACYCQDSQITKKILYTENNLFLFSCNDSIIRITVFVKIYTMIYSYTFEKNHILLKKLGSLERENSFNR